MNGDDYIDRFFLVDAEDAYVEVHDTESEAVTAAKAYPEKVAVKRRSYFLNDMADEIVWLPKGHADNWPPYE